MQKKSLVKPDSLIFDMDGTLWDAVDTYVSSWNLVFNELNIDKTITRQQLAQMVGWEGKKVLEVLLHEFEPEVRQSIYAQVNELRKSLIPVKGGMLYEGVKEGLQRLAEEYQLFILSNCAADIIRLFIDWAGIDGQITDEIAYGTNYMPKHHNIHMLMKKHALQNPIYIGDTNGDAEQSRLAGIPFVLVTYGFGTTNDYDLKFDDFATLTSYFKNLK